MSLAESRIGWRWIAAGTLFLFALVGFASGVSLTEQGDVAGAGWLTLAYYSLGLFVFGGLELGMPTGGPMGARMLLWTAYFGAPLLTASAVIETLMKAVTPDHWRLRRLANHVVIVGAGSLTITYLRVLRRKRPEVDVVVLVDAIEPTRKQELEQSFGVTVVVGDATHDFMLRQLRLRHASKVVLLPDDNFAAFEVASRILRRYPTLDSRILLHSHNLRFLRMMQKTSIGQRCTCFNIYHLAASGLVRDQLLQHFQRTGVKDVVVLAGFGRFGQTILEELQVAAAGEVGTVAIMDVDAARRVLVVREQGYLGEGYRRLLVQGNVGHPDAWRELSEGVDLSRSEPTVILGTGQPMENLRAALWVKQQWPNALVFTRTNEVSLFAEDVGAENGIISISIDRLVEENIPDAWLGLREPGVV